MTKHAIELDNYEFYKLSRSRYKLSFLRAASIQYSNYKLVKCECCGNFIGIGKILRCSYFPRICRIVLHL